MRYSVIIPAYQCADTLEATVESVFQSGLRDYEIIIIDDGSSDGTAALCRTLAEGNSQIRFRSRENRGVSATRNEGLRMAQGEYVWFLDADDRVDAGALTEVMAAVENHEPDAVFFGMSFDYYHKGKIYRRDLLCYPEEAVYSHEELQAHFDELYDCNALTSSCNKFLRKSILTEHQVQYREDTFLLEDLLLSLDFLAVCRCACVLSKPIYHYRQSEDEGNVYRRIRRIESLTTFVEPFAQRLKRHPVVLQKIYYMMLNQKLWLAGTREIRMIAQDHVRANIEPYSQKDQELDQALRTGHFRRIRWNNKVLQLRHRLADTIKRTSLYQYVKKRG